MFINKFVIYIFLVFFFLTAFNALLLHTLNVLTMICCGDFLFRSCLFFVLSTYCICMSVFFLSLEVFFYDLFDDYYMSFLGFFTLTYAFDSKRFFIAYFISWLLLSCDFLKRYVACLFGLDSLFYLKTWYRVFYLTHFICKASLWVF